MYSQSQGKGRRTWKQCVTLPLLHVSGKKRGFFSSKYSNSDKEKVWVVHVNLYFAFIISNEHTCRSLILDRFCFSSAFTFSHHPYVSLWNKTFKDPGRRWQIEQEQQIFFFENTKKKLPMLINFSWTFLSVQSRTSSFLLISSLVFLLWVEFFFIPSVERYIICSHHYSVLVS